MGVLLKFDAAAVRARRACDDPATRVQHASRTGEIVIFPGLDARHLPRMWESRAGGGSSALDRSREYSR